MNIKTNGYCIENLIQNLSYQIGEDSANQLKAKAEEIVQKTVDVYSKIFGAEDVGINGTGRVGRFYRGNIPDNTTGLIYGKVQSGKTNTTISTLALAQENGFRCFIVLTSNNTWLGKQTVERFTNSINGGAVVYNWEDWKTDPKEFANEIKDYIHDTGVVLVSTKERNHLDRLLEVLKNAKACNVPTLIFDDEADNASLNTNEAKQSKTGKNVIPDSSTFEKIGKIRKEVGNHIYIQITATPQSLLLQNIDHPCKPVFCILSEPDNQKYMGGDLFFENDKHCCIVDANELDTLKQQNGNINPGNNWNIPSGLRLALCCFFLASIYKMKQSNNSNAKYSFLAHICHKKVNHQNLEKIIRSFVVKLDKSIRNQSSDQDKKQALKWLEEAYQELNKTSPDIFPFNKLIEELSHRLRNAIPKVINADNPNKEPQYNPGMNILIGGNKLGRGVTIEGLIITYYGRDAKQKMMDTVHQHARMYGYRGHLLDVTRIFVTEHILEDFRAIHESDEGMRQAIGEDVENIKIKPIWVGKGLQPTRSNVLNPSAIDAFIPGRQIFPRAPLWKKSMIGDHTEKLNSLLANFNQNDDHSYEVEIDFLLQILAEMPSDKCFGYRWEDKRVQQALNAIKSQGINNGILYVRRGRDKKGLDLSNKQRPWRGSGFAQSKWISQPKEQFTNLPILIVMYEKGEQNKGWDDYPLYLPTLVMPKNNFIFMFNYSEESEQ